MRFANQKIRYNKNIWNALQWKKIYSVFNEFVGMNALHSICLTLKDRIICRNKVRQLDSSIVDDILSFTSKWISWTFLRFWMNCQKIYSKKYLKRSWAGKSRTIEEFYCFHIFLIIWLHHKFIDLELSLKQRKYRKWERSNWTPNSMTEIINDHHLFFPCPCQPINRGLYQIKWKNLVCAMCMTSV